MHSVRKKLFSSNFTTLDTPFNEKNDFNISWDSSPDWTSSVTKKFKNDCESPKSRKWITTDHYPVQPVSNFEDLNADESALNLNDSNDSKMNICTQYSEELCSEELRPSTSNNFNESPIIGRFVIERSSPILTCSSPVIGRKRKSRKNFRKKIKNNLVSQENNVGVVNNLFKQSNEIMDFDSSQSQKCYIAISSESVCSENDYLIESVASQECRDIISSSDTTDYTSGCSAEKILKKRKKYKQNGLADQLQRALEKQNIDLAIFRHELYLKKSNELISDNAVLFLKITHFWKEYELTVVCCNYLDRSNELDNCLVIIGFNVVHMLNIKVHSKLKVYKPYETKVVKYKEQDIVCYFNVSKIFSCR